MVAAYRGDTYIINPMTIIGSLVGQCYSYVSHTRGYGGRIRVDNDIPTCPTPEDTVGVIWLIMLFLRPTRGHGGHYRVDGLREMKY